MQEILIIINDAPYGTEKAYNAIRLANQLLKDHDDVSVKLFFMADAISCPIDNQKTPDGYYNIAKMLKVFVRKGGVGGTCGTCMDARGIDESSLLKGIHRSNMVEFANWTKDADKVITF